MEDTIKTEELIEIIQSEINGFIYIRYRNMWISVNKDQFVGQLMLNGKYEDRYAISIDKGKRNNLYISGR